MVEQSLLILYGEHNPLPGFDQYICDQGIQCSVVDVHDLIGDSKIHHRLSSADDAVLWHLPAGEQYNRPSACLHHPLHLVRAVTASYVDEDKDYALQSWQAYVFYFLSQCAYVCNPISHQSLSVSYYYFPRIYRLAQAVGIRVPRYHILHQRKANVHKLGEDYQSTESLLLGVDWMRQTCVNNRAVARIEIGSGDWCRILVIVPHMWALDGEGNRCDLSEKLRDQILLLMGKLNLCFGEVWVLQNSAREYILYSIHPFPHWNQYDLWQGQFFPALQHALLFSDYPASKSRY